MFHKIKSVRPLPDYCLQVHFAEGVTKVYDVKPLFSKWIVFQRFQKEPDQFSKVSVDTGGYGIIWDDELDLSCEELYENGITVVTPFDGLIAFTDATELWGLNESTLRKAISYGKLVVGEDACKFGKQWVVREESMVREYGEPFQLEEVDELMIGQIETEEED